MHVECAQPWRQKGMFIFPNLLVRHSLVSEQSLHLFQIWLELRDPLRNACHLLSFERCKTAQKALHKRHFARVKHYSSVCHMRLA